MITVPTGAELVVCCSRFASQRNLIKDSFAPFDAVPVGLLRLHQRVDVHRVPEESRGLQPVFDPGRHR
jgi:hypothetical protein